VSPLDLPELPLLLDLVTRSAGQAFHALGLLPLIRKFRGEFNPSLIQEGAGFHLGIGSNVNDAARHSAQFFRDRYLSWSEGHRSSSDTPFRNKYFTVAVGGGNTIKNEYKALLRYHFHDIDWLEDVRFFFIEETCNPGEWEAARDCLVENLVEPVAHRLAAIEGSRSLAKRLGLKQSATRHQLVKTIIERLIFPIDLADVTALFAAGKQDAALKKARAEARRYRALLQERLGSTLRFHMILSGIGKDGGIGAFEPYARELQHKTPEVIALKKNNGAISVTLNRGALIGADCISLIISGSLKLRALGRFEMEDSARFEQTVMETPIRMLRETRKIAERVNIFADDRALHFDEDVFRFQENGVQLEVKSEVRDGDEPGGVHIMLVHGFMGLYSYINLLIGLPSAWRVSALRRGKHAKTLPDEDIFPHYARTLRKMILHDWRTGRPTPVCCHSMAGIISDHLILSVLGNYADELPDFEKLKADDKRLIEALRASGIVHIATWVPSDTAHLRSNIENLKKHKKENAKLDFSGPTEIYDYDEQGRLALKAEHADSLMTTPNAIGTLLKIPGTEATINSFNVLARFLAGRMDLKNRLKQQQAPYGQRLLSDRVLKKVSFFGVLKEVNAAMHDPSTYQERHLKALEAVLKYDIPYLVIVHRDDFLVSANRHIQEHKYLLKARKAKEGVTRASDLATSTKLVLLKGKTDEPSVELVDPHFLILSHTHEGGGNARKVTAAMTDFVHETVSGAIDSGSVEPLASIEKLRLRHS
jgi:6-phosphogluconolactonase/glucosamine-6-phosphate isomerase/deaminase